MKLAAVIEGLHDAHQHPVGPLGLGDGAARSPGLPVAKDLFPAALSRSVADSWWGLGLVPNPDRKCENPPLAALGTRGTGGGMPGSCSSQPPRAQSVQIAGVQSPPRRVTAGEQTSGRWEATGPLGGWGPGRSAQRRGQQDRSAGSVKRWPRGWKQLAWRELALGGQRQQKAGLAKGQGPQGPVLGAWPLNCILKMLPLGQASPVPGWGPFWWQGAGSPPAPAAPVPPPARPLRPPCPPRAPTPPHPAHLDGTSHGQLGWARPCAGGGEAGGGGSRPVSGRHLPPPPRHCEPLPLGCFLLGAWDS